MENNSFGDAAEPLGSFGDVAEAPAPPALAAPPPPRVPVESLFGGLDKMANALPSDARRELDLVAKSEIDPNTFKMRAANTAFLADRYGKGIEEAAAGYEQLRDNFAKEQLHELKPLDDAGFYSRVGGQLQKEKDENLMLQEVQVGLFHAMRDGKTFDQAYEAERKTRWTTPGWDAYRQDYYRELSRKTWDNFSASKKRLAEPIDAVGEFMGLAKRGLVPLAGDSEGMPEVRMMAAREKALATLRGLPESDASMVMDLAASQAAKQTGADPEASFMEKATRRIERGVTDFASSAVGAVEEVGRRVFLKPQDAIDSRRHDQLSRQLDQRIRGEVDPLKANGWIANEALNVAEGMPRFMSAFSIPGIVVNYVATKEEIRGNYEDQGVSAGRSDVMSAIAALPQTALNFVSSKMAIGLIPGGSRLIGPITEAGVGGLAKQAGKYLLAESLVQPVLQEGAQLAPSAVQSIAHQLDQTVPDIPGGFLKQAESVIQSTPETFASMIPFILLGTGMGTFHDRTAGKAFVQNETRLTALGVDHETVAAVMEAKTPEEAATALQKGWDNRQTSPEQKAALSTLDQEALKSRAAHGESYTLSQADLMAKYPGTFGMIEPGHIPVEIVRADGKTVPASFSGYVSYGENDHRPVISRLKAEGWEPAMLGPGEKVLTPLPSPEGWKNGARSTQEEHTVKTIEQLHDEPPQSTLLPQMKGETPWRPQHVKKWAQSLPAGWHPTLERNESGDTVIRIDGLSDKPLSWVVLRLDGSIVKTGSDFITKPAEKDVIDAQERVRKIKLPADLEPTIYFRLGHLPEGGKSKNAITGELEKGTSVYRAQFDVKTGGYKLLFTDTPGLFSLPIERPAFRVSGEPIGEVGSDAEPLLSNAQEVGAVKFKRVFGENVRDISYIIKPKSGHYFERLQKAQEATLPEGATNHAEGDNPNPEDPGIPFIEPEGDLTDAKTPKQWAKIAGSLRAIDRKIDRVKPGQNAERRDLLRERLQLQADAGIKEARDALSNYEERLAAHEATPDVDLAVRKYVEEHPLVSPRSDKSGKVTMHGELRALYDNLPPAQRRKVFRADGETNLDRYGTNLVEHLQSAGMMPEGDPDAMANSLLGGEAGILDRILQAHTTKREGPLPSRVEHVAPELTPGERLKVSRLADGSYSITGPHGDLLGTAASAEGAARIVHDQALGVEPSQPTELPQADSKLIEELQKIAPAEFSIMDGIRAKIAEWQKLGIAPRMSGLDFAKSIGLHIRQTVGEFGKLKKFTPLKQALAEWKTKRDLAQLEIGAVVHAINKVAPTLAMREGITNWIQANGDRAILEQRYQATTKLARKLGYKAALELNPDQLKVAEVIKKYYAEKLIEGKAHGLLEHAVENYVTQIWDHPNQLSSKAGGPFRAMLTQNFKFSQEREFGSFFEGEQAGYNPKTKDVGELLAIYTNEMSKVIATRELIKDLTTRKGQDDRPGASPVGASSESEGDGNTKTLIKPMAKSEDTLDYETLNHPALSQWKWLSSIEGKQVMLQGQLGLHPEIYKFVKNALGRSEISRWYESDSDSMTMAAAKAFVQGTENLLSAGKATSLGGVSTFHLAHEVKRVAGNRVNPFDLPILDPKDPTLKRALESTLSIVGDNEAMKQFMEGLGARSLVDYVPGLGRVSKALSEFTFHEFIPRAKYKLWTALVERNTELYRRELRDGSVSQKDIDYLSAQQANARLGHLNYVDLGTNPTLKHIMSLTLLAPDFLRSNLQNYRQAAEGLFSRKGREPVQAFALTAAAVFIACRIMNQLLDDKWHMEEPFGVVHNNRVFTMRNEVEDLWRAVHNPRGYISGRISSFTRLLSELRSGTNWRGENQDAFDTFKDFAAAQIPMSMSGLPGVRELTETGRNSRITPLQAVLSSQGVQVAGRSVINDAYKIAHKYYHDQGGREKKGVYPTSRYQPLRYALEDGNEERAKAQIAKLLKETPEKAKLEHGFHASLFDAFTGSKAMDEAMLESLKGDDKQAVEDAIELRKTIAEHFQQLLDQVE